MAGPLLTFTNAAVWVFAFVMGAYTRDGFQVTGLGALILFCIFWVSDFSTVTLEITQAIMLWFHVELPVVLLMGALAGQEFSRMFQVPRLISFNNPMPFDFKEPVAATKKDAAVDWLVQLFGLVAIATALGINFWAGRTFGYPSGLSPIGVDLTTVGIVVTIIGTVLLVLLTVILTFVDDPAASMSAKYLWLSLFIPLAALIQTYAQYTWGWNNGWPEFLWYGLLTVAFIIVTLLSIYVPVAISAKSRNAILIDVLYDAGKFTESRAFAWIYYGAMYATVVVGTLLFNLIAQWEDQPPNVGSYVFMGYSAFLIIFFIIMGAVLFSRFEKLPNRQARQADILVDGRVTHINLRNLE
jgi:hypothetical protein